MKVNYKTVYSVMIIRSVVIQNTDSVINYYFSLDPDTSYILTGVFSLENEYEGRL